MLKSSPSFVQNYTDLDLKLILIMINTSLEEEPSLFFPQNCSRTQTTYTIVIRLWRGKVILEYDYQPKVLSKYGHQIFLRHSSRCKCFLQCLTKIFFAGIPGPSTPTMSDPRPALLTSTLKVAACPIFFFYPSDYFWAVNLKLWAGPAEAVKKRCGKNGRNS